MSTSTSEKPTRIITIGVGGATSSGKTTLAKHLRNCLPNSFTVHQDDFVPPAEKLPIDPEYGFENWDDPEGAIEWDRMAAFVADLKKTGTLPADHQSFDSFNQTANVAVDEKVIADWKAQSEKLAAEHLEKHGEQLVWAIIDGFLLYWDKASATRIVSDLDVRAVIRVPEEIARARREARSYYTPEGETWTDPPHYWEKIVWPAYIRAHKHLFENEDVVNGGVSGKVEGLMLFESTSTSMTDMVNTVMKRVVEVSAAK
ncbi:P-loop containing nucleoside triphosphate hydrolase protein [Punctularia strigosozonata HHB-11173 SS5]|uniref:P-loop containing nucleoside triphosphate hydrolase protein n=1 Tax=Punctularia strigosozonata (strain HHB-11173) TaxID=741275 RepID=UPI0004417607|nr:P-loop containing nucleoside triphosphate hydrolase protein [Punctularia strigosozonata HHB-11173 SS5]EIN11147.1 P-loop containing nucleoside triphosphate hydrolase protein [Punctularia strigosozonata HHB-11173 SS5]